MAFSPSGQVVEEQALGRDPFGRYFMGSLSLSRAAFAGKAADMKESSTDEDAKLENGGDDETTNTSQTGAEPTDEAAAAFKALRLSSTATLAGLTRRSALRQEVAKSARALQTLFDTWHKSEDADVRRNCALALARVHAQYPMHHDDAVLPVLGLCVAENGAGVMMSAMTALRLRLADPTRPLDLIFLPGILAAVQSVVNFQETTLRLRRACAEVLHLALQHSADTRMGSGDSEGRTPSSTTSNRIRALSSGSGMAAAAIPVASPSPRAGAGSGAGPGFPTVAEGSTDSTSLSSSRITHKDRHRILRVTSMRLSSPQQSKGGAASGGNGAPSIGEEGGSAPVFGSMGGDGPYVACKIAMDNGLLAIVTRLIRSPPPSEGPAGSVVLRATRAIKAIAEYGITKHDLETQLRRVLRVIRRFEKQQASRKQRRGSRSRASRSHSESKDPAGNGNGSPITGGRSPLATGSSGMDGTMGDIAPAAA